MAEGHEHPLVYFEWHKWHMLSMVGSWHIIDRYGDLIVCEMKHIRF